MRNRGSIERRIASLEQIQKYGERNDLTIMIIGMRSKLTESVKERFTSISGNGVDVIRKASESDEDFEERAIKELRGNRAGAMMVVAK